MFFGARGNQAFSFNVTADTPSPRTKTLPKKHTLHPRDSGIALSEDDDDLLGVPRASSSVSSIYSDEGLVTPGVEPEAGSGWPSVFVQGHDEAPVDVDAFIRRTLAAGAKAAGGTEPATKKAPGTPVKKVKTSYLVGGPDRPWQSAVAHKVGLPGFSWDGNTVGGAGGGKNKPRKSLPAVFPALQTRKHGKAPVDPTTDSEGEEESPSGRRGAGKYLGLGLGRPGPAPGKGGLAARTRWLTRRSSSGAFSSGSDTASLAGTPTRAKGHRGASIISLHSRSSFKHWHKHIFSFKLKQRVLNSSANFPGFRLAPAESGNTSVFATLECAGEFVAWAVGF
jgi:mitosis inhibitor protein kinase SWE1